MFVVWCRLAFAVLGLYYFWVTLGPLSRGSAAVGLAALVGMALACDLPVRSFVRAVCHAYAPASMGTLLYPVCHE